jgi:G:T/U-mismatch repair DNA glycosylase
MKSSKLLSAFAASVPGAAETLTMTPRRRAAGATRSCPNLPSPTAAAGKKTRHNSVEEITAVVSPDVASRPKKKPRTPPTANSRRTPALKRDPPVPPPPRTESFDAFWAGSLLSPPSPQPLDTPGLIVEPHTLLLGTHPSIASLSESQYYGHIMNAFWWIAGDCLGFRRGSGVSASTGVPYAFAHHLRHTNILPYEQQLERLVRSGFCLWDVIGSCVRPGSLDQDIQHEHPNDIYAFCQEHPTIRRIVLCNGGTGSRLFCKHFAQWFATGQLVAADHAGSQKAFGAAIRRQGGKNMNTRGKEGWSSGETITLISAISVSPAAARFSYLEKREFWEEHVYRPGLALLDETNENGAKKSPYFS